MNGSARLDSQGSTASGRVGRGGWTWQIGVALLLVLLAEQFVLQRTEDAGIKYLAVRGDTLQYVAMVVGDETARAPFKYRVLVPWLAGLLPLDPLAALQLVTYSSLVVFYVAVLRVAAVLDLPRWAAVAGLCLAYATPVHLYAYHNPFLVDGTELAVLSLMLLGFFRADQRLFATALIIGVFARETAIFLAPLWLLRHPWQGLAMIGLALAALVAVRLDTGLWNAASQAVRWDRIADPLLMARQIALTWRHAWLYLAAGLLLVPSAHRRSLGTATLLLLTGALLTSLMAVDITRMFALLSPVLALAAAFYLHALGQRSQIWLVLVVGMALALVVLEIPTVLSSGLAGEDGTAVALLALGVKVLLFLVTALMLRGQLVRGLAEIR